MGTRIVAPYVWGWLADHTGRRIPIVRMASLLAAVAFAGVFAGTDYWWLALVMSAFSFFWNASLPQLEATTMNHLGSETRCYSRIRLWGSVGFIVTVAGIGPLLDRYGACLLPAIVLALFIAIWLSSLAVPESAADHRRPVQDSLRRVLGRPMVISLFSVCFLMQASHGPYYTFFTIYLENFGYSRTVIGQLWALGVVAEIGIFLIMPRLLSRFGARQLLLFAASFTSLRWLLIAVYPLHISIVGLAQTLHAASFGLYHAVSIHLIHRLFTGIHQGRGQALYSSLSFGAGGAAGSLASGYLWKDLGPEAMFLLAAVVSLTALGVAFRGIKGEC
jgi:PPP family 3-phenylpropionic acid transporter